MSDNSNKQKKDFEFFDARTPKRTYVSKSWNRSGDPRAMRIVNRVEEDERVRIAFEKKEKVLRVTPSGKVQWKAVVVEDDRNKFWVTLQRYEAKTGKPHRPFHFSFSPEELTEFLKFIQSIKILPLRTSHRTTYEAQEIDALLSGDEQWFEIFENKVELLEEFVRNRLTKTDLVTLGYRKKQLSTFEKLLLDKQYFEKVSWRLGQEKQAKPEYVWQTFFEQNQWIFGYGLNYVFSTGLDGGGLERVTSGFNFLSGGKRIDALMRTRGAISSICFVEIKTPSTPLLHKQYRGESWSVSSDVTGAIAQVQRTVQKSISELKNIFTSRIETKDAQGVPSGEFSYLYEPKSFVIIGDLSEFITDKNRVNETKFSSFEMFRRNTTNPEILTFDELYERAKYIVAQTEEYRLVSEIDVFDVADDITNIDPNEVDNISW